MKKTSVFVALLALLAVAGFGFEKTQNLSVPAQGLSRLEISAGAGFLRVSGREGAGAVEVKAEIVVSGVDEKEMEAYIKDHVELELRSAGGAAILVSKIRERGFFFPREARIDLTVMVPKTLALEIDDGSGELSVEDMAAGVRIDDGSGELRVERIAGNLRIDDGSGEITVKDIEGNVEIVDGSGEVDVTNVTGDLSLDDGSGGVDLRKIGGTVTIDDGSGSLTVDDVGKDVRIKHKGSGSTDITNVRGKVIR
ncbi:MAG TPA: hypothetical protein VLJ16_09330 [Acidobacteriota bacterium]|nr:hypothetical protein [Acidobacteriota bacterium]